MIVSFVNSLDVQGARRKISDYLLIIREKLAESGEELKVMRGQSRRVRVCVCVCV